MNLTETQKDDMSFERGIRYVPERKLRLAVPVGGGKRFWTAEATLLARPRRILREGLFV